MRRLLHILVFMVSMQGYAQSIRTIVPKQALIAGNAFQVQYIITGPADFESIIPPVSDSVQLVSGPNIYTGNMVVDGKMQTIRNLTFTLVARYTGRTRIPSTTASFKSGTKTTTDAFVTVLPQSTASFNSRSSSTDEALYAPASQADLDQLVHDNLFIRTEVNRQSCFQGEAIVATFKLYSRLQSTSEVVNSPSLYGFSVMDMLNINESHTGVETIDGKVFNTSILRRLQLFPEQSGTLVIDPMELDHTIEFDVAHGKKQIVKKTGSSPAIKIQVLPLPAKKPASFNGAVGQFQVSLSLPGQAIYNNTTAHVLVRISGSGNFIQFGAPAIKWPPGFDVFEPRTREAINRSVVPVHGWVEYEYPFVSSRTGSFTIPPLQFSFFDPAVKNFVNLTSDSLLLQIQPKKETSEKLLASPGKKTSGSWWLYIPGLLLLCIAVFLVYKKTRGKDKKETGLVLPDPHRFSARLKQVEAQHLPDAELCSEVQKILRVALKELGSASREQEQLAARIHADCQQQIYLPLQDPATIKNILLQARMLLLSLEENAGGG